MSLGEFHTCARITDGTVWCWGGNLYHQLGDGRTNHPCPSTESDCSPVPVQVPGISAAVDVSAGYTTTCTVKIDGSCWCWGVDAFGTMGGATSATPKRMNGISGAQAVACGNAHVCARTGDGAVWCWGKNDQGQLGGPAPGPGAPAKVSNLGKARSVVVGLSHTCALVDDGTVWCWGSNEYGQLGNGQSGQQGITPVRVLDLTDVAEIASRGDHTCARNSTGALWCWGHNHFGELGNGGFSDSNRPVAVLSLTDVQSVAAGYFHTCVVRKDSSVWCWGADDWGQLGDGAAPHQCPVTSSGFQHDCAPSPVRVTAAPESATIAAGASHTCALAKSGALWCWGANDSGQLGDGTIAGASTPVQTRGLLS